MRNGLIINGLIILFYCSIVPGLLRYFVTSFVSPHRHLEHLGTLRRNPLCAFVKTLCVPLRLNYFVSFSNCSILRLLYCSIVSILFSNVFQNFIHLFLKCRNILNSKFPNHRYSHTEIFMN